MTPIFIVSAPSGTGKTTLNNRLASEFPNIHKIVTYTSRPIREGEVHGKSYHFISKEEFEEKIKKNEMLEWSLVFGNYYGNRYGDIFDIQKRGGTPILEIDVQGWQKLRGENLDATSIMLLPPSIEELWKRLMARGTEKEEIRWRRLFMAKQEILASPIYDHFIVNDSFDDALRELKRIIVDGEPALLNKKEGEDRSLQLLQEFDSSGWIQSLRQKYGAS